jgi:excisionase family DNA binding protein
MHKKILEESSMAETLTRAIVEDGLDTVESAKAFLQVSRSFLYGLMEAGKLEYVKLGKARRIPRRALIDLAARGLVGVDGK